MVEGVAQRVFDDALRLDGRELVLGLADEFRLADEDESMAAAEIITSSVVMMAARLFCVSSA